MMRSGRSSQDLSSKSQSRINGQFAPGAIFVATENHMKTIHSLELEERIQANEAVEILDLRPRCQFEKRHVPGAHSIPFNEFDAETLVHSRELPLTEPLYLISERGEHAQIAAENMERRGLDNLVVIEGGMQGWERNGLPVDRSGNVGIWMNEHRKRMFDMGMVTEFCDVGAL
jgi:rhodanese-related sulfurtransferase